MNIQGISGLSSLTKCPNSTEIHIWNLYMWSWKWLINVFGWVNLNYNVIDLYFNNCYIMETILDTLCALGEAGGLASLFLEFEVLSR
jgi:hypothetical protein